MSIHVISWVLQHSESQKGERLVEIVLADHADKDGCGARPAVATVAHEARLKARAVQYALRSLEKKGWIVREGTTERGVAIWQVVMERGAKTAPVGVQAMHRGGAKTDAERGANDAPKPSLREPSENRSPDQVTPPQLIPVIATLNRVVEGKGAKPLKRGAALKACRDFADRDIAREGDRFGHYWLDGAGENRTLRDVAGAWRNWLRTSPRATALARRNGASAASRTDADIERLERMKGDLPEEAAA